VIVSVHGALEAGRGALAGQHELAAQLARQRAVAPVLGGQAVAQHQRDVAGGVPGAGQREGLRPQEARVGVDPPGDRAVVAEVEIEGDRRCWPG
jgi:hypothetical protein